MHSSCIQRYRHREGTEQRHSSGSLVDRLTKTLQERAGPWRNYFIGVIGTFAPDEDDVLWPNQVGLATDGAQILYMTPCFKGRSRGCQPLVTLSSTALHQHTVGPVKWHSFLQVLYGLRTMFNVRNGQDLAQFLADPQREEFDSHSSHLSRIQVQLASCQQHVATAHGAVLALR